MRWDEVFNFLYFFNLFLSKWLPSPVQWFQAQNSAKWLGEGRRHGFSRGKPDTFYCSQTVLGNVFPVFVSKPKPISLDACITWVTNSVVVSIRSIPSTSRWSTRKLTSSLAGWPWVPKSIWCPDLTAPNFKHDPVFNPVCS